MLSIDNVVSGITHCISGFAALYIMISGMTSMKKKNIPITLTILLSFAVAAYLVNVFVPNGDSTYNYMFLMRGYGTPYDILYNMVGGNPVIYPILVVLLFVIYVGVFYWVYYLIKKKREESKNDPSAPTGENEPEKELAEQ